MKPIHDWLAKHYEEPGITVHYYHDELDPQDDLYGPAYTTICWWLGKREVCILYRQDKIVISATQEYSHHIPLADPDMINKMMKTIHQLIGF